jgi:hypothetical protein
MKKSSRMSIVHPHATGVDIGAEFHLALSQSGLFRVLLMLFSGCLTGSKPVTLRPSPWSPLVFTGCLLLRSLK